MVLAQPVVRRHGVIQLVLFLALLFAVGDAGADGDGFGGLGVRGEAEGDVELGEVGGFVRGRVVPDRLVGVEVVRQQVFGGDGGQGAVRQGFGQDRKRFRPLRAAGAGGV